MSSEQQPSNPPQASQQWPVMVTVVVNIAPPPAVATTQQLHPTQVQATAPSSQSHLPTDFPGESHATAAQPSAGSVAPDPDMPEPAAAPVNQQPDHAAPAVPEPPAPVNQQPDHAAPVVPVPEPPASPVNQQPDHAAGAEEAREEAAEPNGNDNAWDQLVMAAAGPELQIDDEETYSYQVNVRELHVHLDHDARSRLLHMLREPENPRFVAAIVRQWILHPSSWEGINVTHLNWNQVREWVGKLKLTAKLVCLMMVGQSAVQNCQSCINLADCYPEEAKGYTETLFKVASSFSRATWPSDHGEHMLAIFHTLVDVLSSIYDSSCSIAEFRHVADQLPGIFGGMKTAFCGIVDRATENVNEQAGFEVHMTHSSTTLLVKALDFFQQNRVMAGALLDPHVYAVDLRNCWICKLTEDAENLFRNELDRQYLFILNNISYVGENIADYHEEQNRLRLLMGRYIRNYLAGVWRPLVDVKLSPKKFMEHFTSTWKSQSEMKIRSEDLLKKLRESIQELIVPVYEQLTNQGGLGRCLDLTRKKTWTLQDLTDNINGCFESVEPIHREPDN